MGLSEVKSNRGCAGSGSSCPLQIRIKLKLISVLGLALLLQPEAGYFPPTSLGFEGKTSANSVSCPVSLCRSRSCSSRLDPERKRAAWRSKHWLGTVWMQINPVERKGLSWFQPHMGQPYAPRVPFAAFRACGRDDECIWQWRSIFQHCLGVKRLSWEGSHWQLVLGEERGEWWHGKPCHLSPGFPISRVSTLSYLLRKLLKGFLIFLWSSAVPVLAARSTQAIPQGSFCQMEKVCMQATTKLCVCLTTRLAGGGEWRWRGGSHGGWDLFVRYPGRNDRLYMSWISAGLTSEALLCSKLLPQLVRGGWELLCREKSHSIWSNHSCFAHHILLCSSQPV